MDILDEGPADEIGTDTPSWDTLARRHRAAAERFERLARASKDGGREVGRAVRDGLVFEAASHLCAAVVGVGLWPLAEYAVHAVAKVVLG